MQNAKAKKNQVKPAANNCLFIFIDTMLISSVQVLSQIFAQIMLKVIVQTLLKALNDQDEEIKKAAIKEDKITVVRRSSGGGTVMQGKGCFNYSLILSKERHPQIADLKSSYSLSVVC